MLPKKFRFISSAALIVLGLILALMVLTRHEQIQAASAAEKPVTPAQNQPAAAPAWLRFANQFAILAAPTRLPENLSSIRCWPLRISRQRKPRP